MWEHTMEDHGGRRGLGKGEKDYEPNMVGTFRDPLGRTQDEGIQIKNDEDNPEIKTLIGVYIFQARVHQVLLAKAIV